jgi:hypothetical protein
MTDQRTHYRKNLRVVGKVFVQGDGWSFSTRNLSITGLSAHFPSDPGLPEDKPVYLSLPDLQLEGYAYPIWNRADDHEGGVYVGFEFDRLRGTDTNRYQYLADAGLTPA